MARLFLKILTVSFFSVLMSIIFSAVALAVDIYEPNDAPSQATQINSGVSYNGSIDLLDDLDFYKINTGIGNILNLTLDNLPADYDVAIFDSSMVYLIGSENSGTIAENISSMTTGTGGVYYILVYSALGDTSGSNYRLMVDLIGSPPSGISPVYRFWSDSKQGHFYTISPQEKDHVIATWPTIWSYEGMAYYARTALATSASPVYRFWSDSKQGHFYTNSLAEKNHVIATWPTIWSYEGIAYYAKN